MFWIKIFTEITLAVTHVNYYNLKNAKTIDLNSNLVQNIF